MSVTGYLTRVLKPEYQEVGFSLIEDEHSLYLHLKGAKIATFPAQEATEETVGAECDRWLHDLCPVCGADKRAYKEMMGEECSSGHGKGC